MECTKKKVVHRVNDNLFDQIKVWEARELSVASSVLLDKILASSRCAKLTIAFAKSTMLLAGPATKRYRRERERDDVAHMVQVAHLLPGMLSPGLCHALISNRVSRSGYGNGMQNPPFYGLQVCRK